MHEAIEKGALPVCRENGKSFDGRTEHVAPERRHVTRQDLKEWIAREFPADKPAFLFDEVERKTHAAINADAYFRALQADRDALKSRIDNAEEWAKTIDCRTKRAAWRARFTASDGGKDERPRRASRDNLSEHHRGNAGADVGQVASGKTHCFRQSSRDHCRATRTP